MFVVTNVVTIRVRAKRKPSTLGFKVAYAHSISECIKWKIALTQSEEAKSKAEQFLTFAA